MGTKAEGDKCYASALPAEPMFVLLARDPQAPELVRKWAMDRENKDSTVLYPQGVAEDGSSYGRFERGVSDEDKAQIAEARYCAARMEVWRYENNGKWRDVKA